MTASMEKSINKNLIEMLEKSRKLYADRPLYGTKGLAGSNDCKWSNCFFEWRNR